MSKPDPNLSHATEDIARYVRHLGAMPYIEKVYLVGSRSPKSHKEARPDSDWDIMPKKSDERGHLTWPRRSPYFLLADLFPYRERSDMAEVWPNDEYGVFK